MTKFYKPVAPASANSVTVNIDAVVGIVLGPFMIIVMVVVVVTVVIILLRYMHLDRQTVII